MKKFLRINGLMVLIAIVSVACVQAKGLSSAPVNPQFPKTPQNQTNDGHFFGHRPPPISLPPANGGLSSAPVNPEFIAYLQNREANLLDNQTSDGYFLGHIPPPIQIPKTVATVSLIKALSLPTKFDLRTVNGLTPIKNHGACGSCWSFATYGSLESYLKYKGVPKETRDFSEADLNQYHGFDFRECEGGNWWMSTAYLARWDGPVNEIDEPYFYALAPQSAPGVAVQKHVQSVWFMPDRANLTDNTTVKTAIQSYGAVVAAFHYGDKYYSPTNAAYYSTKSKSDSNHEINLVGWDNNYPKTKFKSGLQPPANGAFIARNHWGSKWGENGYFYISYYDKSLTLGASFYNAQATNNYTRAYEYDPLGWNASLGINSTTAQFANLFKAAANATKIKAVSFYTPVANSTYQISIYNNVESTVPTNGTKLTTVTGTLARRGYNTIATFKAGTNPPAVTAGKRFSVVVKLTTPNFKYPIPVETNINGYSSAANAYTGQSFVFNADGDNDWDDLATFQGLEKTNVALKAFGG